MAEETDVAGGITARVRRNLATGHLLGAGFFAREALSLESDDAATLENSYSTIRSYVIGSVLMSVAAVEAHFNELMADEGTSDWFLDLVERRALIDRHNFYLRSRNLPAYVKGEPPAQGLDLLIRLRNALVHFRPDWDDIQEHHGRLARRLVGAFPLCPLVPPDTAPFFPTRCLSSGCARWAVTTAWEFATDFAERLGREPRVAGLSEHLGPDEPAP